MRIILTYILFGLSGIALLSTCFGGGGEANKGQLTIQNDTSYTLIPSDRIQVWADQGRSRGCNIWIGDFPNIPAGQTVTWPYQGAYNCFYWDLQKVNYKFLVKLKRTEGDINLFVAEVNYSDPEDNQWADPFGTEDEKAHYKETLRIIAEDELLEGKPGIKFSQCVRRIAGGTDPDNWRIKEIREAGGKLEDCEG